MESIQGVRANKMPFFSKKYAPKNASIPSMYRIVPACVSPVTWPFYDFDKTVI